MGLKFFRTKWNQWFGPELASLTHSLTFPPFRVTPIVQVSVWHWRRDWSNFTAAGSGRKANSAKAVNSASGYRWNDEQWTRDEGPFTQLRHSLQRGEGGVRVNLKLVTFKPLQFQSGRQEGFQWWCLPCPLRTASCWHRGSRCLRCVCFHRGQG